MTYIPQPTKTEGGQQQVVVSDNSTQQILSNVLKELKKMNLYLELVSDNKITDQEIE